MEKFTKHVGKCVPLLEANIDTDQIVPKKFLLSISRSGFSKALFYDWRFDKTGAPNPEFVLNKPRYDGATILIAGSNFGCGSSREHAPWALLEYGFRVIVAPSFADIFYNNCFKIGLLPVVLDERKTSLIIKNAENQDDYSLAVDLIEKSVFDELSFRENFEIDDFRRYSLLNGLDDIDLTLMKQEKISKYEKNTSNFIEKPTY